MTETPEDLSRYKSWTPSAQDAVAAALRDIESGRWKPFYCKRVGCDGSPHDEWGWTHARAAQHPPKGNWMTWAALGGRGSGKTRTGCEWVHRRTKVSGRIALVSPTGPDARDVLVEGESGILATARPGKTPTWEPSKRKLTWPNGAVASIYSGEEPDRLRGPQHHDALVDEGAHIPLMADVWDNLLLGLRLGPHPRICATTTPKPTKWMKELLADPGTVAVRMTTYDNLDNLAPTFRAAVLARYEGTRKGRQELLGEIVEDVDGALWNSEMIDPYRVAVAPDLDRVVVGVDPAGGRRARNDETGIVVAGIADGHMYVLADGSGRYSPNGWASKVVSLYEAYLADAVVPERNYGGDMVAEVLRNAQIDLPIREVTSRRGKVIRAEPIAALYERGQVHHVGVHHDLETQLCGWTPGDESPDRLDALVHALTALAKNLAPSSIAVPSQLQSRIPVG